VCIREPGNRDVGWERCLDLAGRWLAACGEAECHYVAQELDLFTDDELADKCINCLRLDQPQGDENDITWFEQHEANRPMLIDTFGAIRGFLTGKSY
jgi:hypothetical protein